MKTAIYSPYLDTFGGGEKYMMTIAEVLSSKGSVDVLLDLHLYLMGYDFLKTNLTKRFNLDLTNVNFIKAPIGVGSDIIGRFLFLKKYDLLFCLTDGSIFYPSAKKNFLHIQSPLIGQPAKSILGKIKLFGWDLIIYNSKFTKSYSEKNWPQKSEIIYPPVDTRKIKPLKKQKYILSVGRFFGYLKSKKHGLLIKAFKSLYRDSKFKDWSLILVGSASQGDLSYLEELKDLAKNIPVIFYPNLDYDNLIKLYGEASIYWHAAGFEEVDPTKMEHFGISVVEAMSGGAVPVVIEKGGLPEIVTDKKSGYLWQTEKQLKELTAKLAINSRLLQKMSREAIVSAKSFSKENFAKKILNLTNLEK